VASGIGAISRTKRRLSVLKAEVAKGKGGRVIVMDSITKVEPEDKGSIVVSASHGGASSGEFALEVPLKAAFFNDAGVGKDDAGIVALAWPSRRSLYRPRRASVLMASEGTHYRWQGTATESGATISRRLPPTGWTLDARIELRAREAPENRNTRRATAA
jgi:hypothetical protein